MPSLVIKPQKPVELKDLAGLDFTYDPSGAESLHEGIKALPVQIPPGRYHAVLRDGEAHIYPIDSRIDRYRLKDDAAAGIDLRDDGIAVSVDGPKIGVVILHSDMLPADLGKAGISFVTRGDFPALDHINEYRELASSGSADPEAISRMIELLERIQAVYAGKDKDPNDAAGGRPVKPRARTSL